MLSGLALDFLIWDPPASASACTPSPALTWFLSKAGMEMGMGWRLMPSSCRPGSHPVGCPKHPGCEAMDEAEPKPKHAAWRTWVLFFKKQELQFFYKAINVTSRDM